MDEAQLDCLTAIGIELRWCHIFDYGQMFARRLQVLAQRQNVAPGLSKVSQRAHYFIARLS
jgi:hypothetical protein